MTDDPITRRLQESLPAANANAPAGATAAWRVGRRHRLIRRGAPLAALAAVAVVALVAATMGGSPKGDVVVADRQTTTTRAARDTTTTTTSSETTTTTMAAPATTITSGGAPPVTPTTAVAAKRPRTTTTRPSAVVPLVTTTTLPTVVDHFTARCPASTGVHDPAVDVSLTMPLLRPLLARANPTGLPVLTCRTVSDGSDLAPSEITALTSLGVQIVTEIPEVRYTSPPPGLQCDRRVWCYTEPIVWLDYAATYYPGTSPKSFVSVFIEALGCFETWEWLDVANSTFPDGAIENCGPPPNGLPRSRTFGEPD